MQAAPQDKGHSWEQEGPLSPSPETVLSVAASVLGTGHSLFSSEEA